MPARCAMWPGAGKSPGLTSKLPSWTTAAPGPAGATSACRPEATRRPSSKRPVAAAAAAGCPSSDAVAHPVLRRMSSEISLGAKIRNGGPQKPLPRLV